jgi:hypothetical protein
MTTPLSAAIDAINEAVPPDAEAKLQVIAAKCIGLCMGYDARWGGVPFEVLSVEEFVTSGLYNPETDRPSRTFTLAGKKDVVVRYERQRVLIDHKTTSDNIEDPNSPYWRQLKVEDQPSHYMLIDWLNGQKIDYALWDVIRKPGISPKDISAKDHQMAIMSKTYCGYRISDDSIASLAVSKRETMEMYTARLAQDCISERPNRYFQRRPVPRLDHHLAEHAQETWDIAQEVIAARRRGRWARTSKACMAYNSPCRYLGLCSGYDSMNSGNWTRKAQVHSELPIVDSDGRNVMTFSRLSTYKACRKKHWFQYEIGLERVDEEEKENLFFGTLIHKALEQWFLVQKHEQGESDKCLTDTLSVA